DTAGKELAGAELTLTGTDFEGNKVQFSETDVTFGEGAKFVSDGDTLTWVSGSEATLVKNLPDGTYVLHEIAAPNGYAVATDITFTVAGGTVSGNVGVSGTTVTMLDEIVPVTTESTVSTTTTTSTSKTTKTTTAKTTTTTTTKSDAPKTGDKGTAIPVLALAMAAGAAFAFRKKREDENED
ncbi:MAG: LPXTG cell wall anchor domain-containing protein, partial [Ruminococcus sp.]|nr:LPXTG cell wall anchor domain-containing protein [Ruminococcus sp.]